MNKQRGITLIALVVTIIVLIILAAVSITMLIGENGILKRTEEAKNKYKQSQVEEEIILAYNTIQLYSNINNWDINKRAEELANELQKQDSTAVVTVDETNLKISYKGYEKTISESGAIIDIEENVKAIITINGFYISGTRVETVPIPDNFYYVGGTIDEGYVISDNSADENKGVDSEELVGSQFVWIPVEKDQKITIDVSSEEEITSLVLTDPYVEDILTLSNLGTSYKDTEIEPTANGTYRLTVTTESGELKKVFLYVHSLYAFDSQYDLMFEDAIKAQLEQMKTEILTDDYAKSEGFADLQDMLESEGFNSVEEVLEAYENGSGESFLQNTQLDETFSESENYKDKVNTNGGFYIGRYETSYEGGKAVSKKSTSTRVEETTELKDGMLWNFIEQEDALTNAKAYNTTVTSSLLTGAAWDRTLGWLYETGEKNASELANNSISWGNYINDTFSNTEELINTGTFIETKANNIYDLAGNLFEWTSELSNSNPVARGGCYSDDDNGFGAIEGRDSVTVYSSRNVTGFRLALYL